MRRPVLVLGIALLCARGATADPISLIGSGAVLGSVRSSEASMLGQTLAVDWWFPDAGTSIFSTTVVVTDPDVELPRVGNGAGAIDIGEGFITIEGESRGWGGAPFNGFVFTDVLGTIPNFTSLTLVSIAGFAPPISPDLSFTADRLAVNFTPTGQENVVEGPRNLGQVYTFAFTTGGTSAPVPEPSSAVLVATGLLSAAIIRRWRQRKG